MSVALHLGRSQNNQPIVLIEQKVEPVDAMQLMRNLRKQFPEEYAAIGRELDVPAKKLVLNGELPQK